MSEAGSRVNVPRIMTAVIVFLVLFAILMVLLGELLVAGVAFLSLTFAIYLRESWS